MDLVGEMILSHLVGEHAHEISATRVCPPYRYRAGRLPVLGGSGPARNVDRLWNRMRDYPRYLRGLARRSEFELYHVVDHSYSQLVHALPKGRAVVTCHDLDTFRCLLEPSREPRPAWFRAMAGRIFDGLSQAAAIVCDSEATREALLVHQIVSPDRLHVVLLGLPPEFSCEPVEAADREALGFLGPVDREGPPEILHVGSNIPRKRIDVLLKVFARIHEARPGARLVKIGGAFPVEFLELANNLGISDSIVTLPFLRDRAVVAAVYRRASLVLLTSDAEGFGLPAVEALACGTPLLASDLPVLREVGGEAPVFRPVGDIDAWAEAALSLLDEPTNASEQRESRRRAGLLRAGHFSWSQHADQLVMIYRDVLSRLKK